MSDGINVVEECENWNSIFAKVVDDTLKQIFQKDGATVIYDFLEKNSGLNLEDIAENPEVFSANLERLMVSASRVIEQTILKNLYSKLGLKFKEKRATDLKTT